MKKPEATAAKTIATRPLHAAQPDPARAKGAAEPNSNGKLEALEMFRDHPDGAVLTTDQGIPIADSDNSLRATDRGPTLLEDFHLREKITHFDHERIPERVVHARGSAAHGFFQVYESMAEYTRAAFLCDPSVKTPVFVRFSTVAGSRGSADTVRDVRGFAVKFYTSEGNFDLVGNNMPVFFIQDGMKFPDFVHSVKPEPANEMPQAASAHDSFWDFVSLVPEAAHMVMWAMSDRAIPRSYRMMEGFGVHTFRLINAEGKAHLIKWHWKPLLGAHSLVWDEAQKIAGKDADFHRRDLWDCIEKGGVVEYELGVQIVAEGDDLKYGFDMLDPTKLLPEELVPVRRIGKLTLNRNPQNFFAETEQSAFHLGNIVPGIDFTNDPLLHARLFSYVDTQLTRLGGPNFAEIPINRPIVPVNNHQQDGLHRDTINVGKANYHPNSIGGGCPFLAGTMGAAKVTGFKHYEERVEGHKIRARSPSFLDYFSQATLFFNSLSKPERMHVIDACRFEVSKVGRKEIRERAVAMFNEIDPGLAQAVAAGVGVEVPAKYPPLPPGTTPPTHRGDNGGLKSSPALSLENQPKTSIKTRKIALLAGGGFAAAEVRAVCGALLAEGAEVEVISNVMGVITGDDGSTMEVDKTFLAAASVFYDAVYVPGGAASLDALDDEPEAPVFVREAYGHFKPIAASGDAVSFLAAIPLGTVSLATSDAVNDDVGVVTSLGGGAEKAFASAFVAAIAKHRHWDRADKIAKPLRAKRVQKNVTP